MDRDGTLGTPSPLRETRKSRVALCYAEGNGRQWEAFCLSFDLAVQGESFEDVYRKLNDQIAMFAASVSSLAPDDQRRMWSRRMPLSLQALFAGKLLAGMVRGHDQKSRHEYSIPIDGLTGAA